MLSKEAWPLSPKSWQEPAPFGMHRREGKGKEELMYFWVPCLLEWSPSSWRCYAPGPGGLMGREAL